MNESVRSRFRKLIGGEQPPAPPASEDKAQAGEPARAPMPKADAAVPPLTERVRTPTPQRSQDAKASQDSPPATLQEAQLFLQQLRLKMARLAEEFSKGKLNSKQFQEIYAHYQKQRNILEAAIYDMPDSDVWRKMVVAGQTGILRQRHAGKVLSYAIYDNATSLPLASVGDFAVDTALVVPMLSSFRSATAEIFGAGLRSTEIEGGRWLCFVPGNYTTLFVIFSFEPARLQLTLIEDLHRDFEVANQLLLEQGQGEEAARQFVRLWALDRLPF